MAIIITVYKYYVNIAVLSQIRPIPIGQYTQFGSRLSSACQLIKKEESLAS